MASLCALCGELLGCPGFGGHHPACPQRAALDEELMEAHAYIAKQVEKGRIVLGETMRCPVCGEPFSNIVRFAGHLKHSCPGMIPEGAAPKQFEFWQEFLRPQVMGTYPEPAARTEFAERAAGRRPPERKFIPTAWRCPDCGMSTSGISPGVRQHQWGCDFEANMRMDNRCPECFVDSGGFHADGCSQVRLLNAGTPRCIYCRAELGDESLLRHLQRCVHLDALRTQTPLSMSSREGVYYDDHGSPHEVRAFDPVRREYDIVVDDVVRIIPEHEVHVARGAIASPRVVAAKPTPPAGEDDEYLLDDEPSDD